MALTPQNNAGFLREVDDELRRDQMVGAWQRYGRWMVAALVLVLALVGGWLWWQHHRATVHGEEGERLNTVMADLGAGRMAQTGVPLADLARSDSAGMRATAMFMQADVLLQKNDLKGAAAKFATVAGDTALPQPFRDLALIRQTTAEYDTLKPQMVVDRLRGLAEKDNPWFGSAGELVATSYLRMNRRDLAGKLFGQIAQTENVPETIRQRAVQMAGALGVDALDQTPKPPRNEDKKAG